MTETDKKLYELLGDKTLSFGCKIIYHDGLSTVIRNDKTGFRVYGTRLINYKADEIEFRHIEIIGHEPTIADLHRWAYTMLGDDCFAQYNHYIVSYVGESDIQIQYDSSKSLITQSEETKLAIISLIESYERKRTS